MSSRKVAFLGFAGSVGGAGTEARETARMFLAHGIEVHMVPTWDSPDPARRAELESIGVKVHCIKPPQVGDLLKELNRPPVVSFCNPKMFIAYRSIKAHSPVVWVNCMTYVTGEERAAWKKNGTPDAFVFQSEFQRRTLELRLPRFGYRPELGHLIRGAFWWPDWEFAPLAREPGTPFVVGRAARADPAKWNNKTLTCMVDVPNIQALCLGVDERVARNLGRHKFARCLQPGAIPAREFYRQLHAAIAYNSGAKENWPRVGLESMATGVPIVADGRFGWEEMIRHGETGFLARRPEEFTGYLEDLERDEELRLRIARQARQSLEQEIANPDAIWRGWCDVFRDIEMGHLAQEPDYGVSPIQKAFPVWKEHQAIAEDAARRAFGVPAGLFGAAVGIKEQANVSTVPERPIHGDVHEPEAEVEQAVADDAADAEGQEATGRPIAPPESNAEEVQQVHGVVPIPTRSPSDDRGMESGCPGPNPRMVDDSLEAFRRGEFLTSEELLAETRSRLECPPADPVTAAIADQQVADGNYLTTEEYLDKIRAKKEE